MLFFSLKQSIICLFCYQAVLLPLPIKGNKVMGKDEKGKGKADPGIFDRLTENMNRSSGATKVVCLTQVVSADELKDDKEYEDIMEHMRLEACKYGIYC